MQMNGRPSAARKELEGREHCQVSSPNQPTALLRLPSAFSVHPSAPRKVVSTIPVSG